MSVGAQISGAIANAQLFQRLEIGREHLRRLTQQVVVAQEEERQRVSRELHDDAGQSLIALKGSLDLIHSQLPANYGELRQHIGKAAILAAGTLEKIRLLAQGLRPPEVEAVGLNQTLAGLCRDFAEHTQLSIDYSGVELSGVPEAINISFYRFLQEALTNVTKHARATQVRVELRGNVKVVTLSVADDGQGFVPQFGKRSARPSQGGIGLLGMQERFVMLGGRLEIKSRAGQGTRLIALCPGRSTNDPGDCCR